MLDGKTLQKETAASEKHLWVRLTKLCNNNCIFCLDKESQDGTSIPTREIYKQLENGRADGASRLILSGGEATLHPEFFSIVRRGKSLGFRRVQVVSNGRMFAYPDFLANAAAAGLDEITFSMHGHTPELHDAQTRAPGSFSQALAGLTNALNSGRFIVNVDIVINRFNYNVIDKIMDYFIGLGVHEFDLLHVTPYGEAWNHKNKVFYDIADGIKFLNKAFAYSRRDDLFVWTNRFPPSYLAAFPELIQNPLKIKDEVRGRMDLFDAFLKGDAELPCRGKRCDFCFLRGLCDDLFRSKEAADSGSTAALRVPASGLSAAKRFINNSLRLLIVHGSSVDDMNLSPSAFPAGAALRFELADYSGFTSFRNRLPNKNVTACAPDAKQLEAVLSATGVTPALELNARGAPLIKIEFNFVKKHGIRLYNKNRASLAESAENDVELRGFFRGALGKSLKTENIPACVADASQGLQTWFLDFEALDRRGGIDMQKLADSFVMNRYYIFPFECGSCAKKNLCPGIHVNYCRAFGFKPKPFAAAKK